MEKMVGIFQSIGPARQAVRDLIQNNIPENAIVLFSKERLPEDAHAGDAHAGDEHGINEKRVAPEKALDKIVDPGSEPTGEGKTAGTVLGAFAGGGAGLGAGIAVASLMVPGLGLITAIGLGGAAVLGLGGAAVGAKVGGAVESEAAPGTPAEQVEFYHELLRRGRSLVLVDVRGGREMSTVREVFAQHGSEDVEVARRELGKAA
jgi:hypothetical protein